MHSTSPRSPLRFLSRRFALLGSLGLAGCVAELAPPGPSVMAPTQTDSAFVMADGGRLPYRLWPAEGPEKAVVLALHGFNDSRDCWALPAPAFAAAGITVYAPDQRGFGAAPGRGLWAGGDAMVDDAATMALLLRAAHPHARLVLVGESMGGAVLMRLATEQNPPVDGYVLSAPAVWGRARMNWLMQSGLWMASTFLPGVAVGRGPVRIRPSDNDEALRQLATNPLTVLSTRFDTLRGLVNLMDQALAAAPRFHAPGLFLYGAHDELVPPEATRTVWRNLPPSAIRAFYPDGYHLLMRDLHRAKVIQDVAAWVTSAASPIDAIEAGAHWLSDAPQQG